jgi:DNA-binding transcriptional ArsR family regulator
VAIYIIPSTFNGTRLWTTYDVGIRQSVYLPVIFKALGDGTRYAMMKLIGSEPRASTELAWELKVSKATISHHPSLLREAGLVHEEAAAGTVRLSLRRDVLSERSAIALAGCSSSVIEPVVETTVDEVEIDVVIDVRDNLLLYFTEGVAKAPSPPPAQALIRFDFRETSRVVTTRGEAVVTGEFLLAIGDESIRRGSIAVFFTLQRLNWVRTGQSEVIEEPVVSHALYLLITDAYSGDPLPGTRVEAVRVDDGVRSSRVELTGLDGRAHLEVAHRCVHAFVPGTRTTPRPCPTLCR